MKSQKSIFRDDAGFTTTGMVLSLLITLALVFTAAQVYRVNSASAEVQDVADAAALAAESQVAEYMILARFCDAVVLSLSLTGLAAIGMGLAALCTPATAAASEGLITMGKNILRQRDVFAERAAQVLNKLQEALPFLAAAAAAGVSKANDGDSSGANYIGVGILVPTGGERISAGDNGKSAELVDEVDKEAGEIREKADRAERASKEAERSKERAFMRDCGDNPNYCMYERAASLAGLGYGQNPLYTSVDAWSFSVALSRARAYYRARYRNEGPADASLEEQARSALRTRFYRYAVNELAKGYVRDTESSFEANIPHLPENTSQMRFTSLYTETIYPITETESGTLVMHAWAGCPEAAATLARGSIAQMESGGFETCDTCRFTAASMGRVAAASTSIANGFEYHYRAVANEALIYQRARHEADVPKSEVRDKVKNLLGKLVEAAKEAADKRIDPEPPGRFGAVALVVNMGETPAAGRFANTFVTGGGNLGPRAAIAASTLVDEGTEEGETAISSLLDGLKDGGGALVGAAGIVLDAWSWMLVAYSNGQSAMLNGIEQGLNSLPLVSASGLGTWASGKLSDAIGDVGLQPAKVGALKPVLVNSAHVVSQGEGAFSQQLLAVKKQVVAHPLMSTDLFSSLLTDAERQALAQVESFDSSIEIASIELLGPDGPSIPVTIPIPQEARDWASGTIVGFFARLQALYFEVSGARVWE